MPVLRRYKVKEAFYSIQGEGINAGRPAVFCRFMGCNLWSGLEHHRASATCRFCDTDFVGAFGDGGGWFEKADDLTRHLVSLWLAPLKRSRPFVILTGGEPLLQADDRLIESLVKFGGCEVAVETNGTIELPRGLEWVCVSPKAGARLVVRAGDELKLVYPQDGLEPETFESLDFRHLLIQPMDGPNLGQNTEAAIAYCKANPRWRLSLQTHKWIGVR